MYPNVNPNKLSRQPLLQRLACLSAGLLIVATLSGCASLVSSGDAPRLYNLTPKTSFEDAVESVTWQLVIEEPSASGGLDTSRIALRPSPTELEFFAGSRWTDRAPAMVQTMLVESFESSGGIVGIGRESIGLRSDFNLRLELREFQAEYYNEGEPPVVRVRINAKIVRQPRQVIIASRSFEATRKVEVDELGEIVRGFDRALGRVMKQLVVWSLEEGQRDSEAKL